MIDKCQYCDMPMNINKFGIAHDFLGRQHGLNSITCVRLQLAQFHQRVAELEAVVERCKPIVDEHYAGWAQKPTLPDEIDAVLEDQG